MPHPTLSLRIAGIALLTLLVGSCQKSNTEPPVTVPQQVSGAVQKGPFVTGTSVTIQPLDTQLNPTGESYETQILDDNGNFLLGSKISAPYAELIAHGYYFNETTNDLSESEITLRSITKLSDDGNNINLLTTLEAERLKYLVTKEHKSFDEARQSAQREVLGGFGITLSEAPVSDRMDISQAGQANAALLAVSSVMQYYRSEAELSELIAKIANDIRDNGRITQPALQAAIREGSMHVTPETVRQNLTERYAKVGATDVHVPDFYSYVDSDGDGKLNGAEPYILLEEETLTLNWERDTIRVSVHTNIDWKASIPAEAAEWLAIDDQTTGDLLVLRATLNTDAPRTAQLILKDQNSALADTLDVMQIGSEIRVRLNLNASWGSTKSKSRDPKLDGMLDNLTVIGFYWSGNKELLINHLIQPVTDDALEFSIPSNYIYTSNGAPISFFSVIANDRDSYRAFNGNSQDFEEYRTTQDLNKLEGPLPLFGIGSLESFSLTEVNPVQVQFRHTVARITFALQFSPTAFPTPPEVLSVTFTGINSQHGRLQSRPEGIDTQYKNDYTMAPTANNNYTFYNYGQASIDQVIVKVRLAGDEEKIYTVSPRQTEDPGKSIIFMAGYAYNYRITIKEDGASSALISGGSFTEYPTK